MDWPYKDKWHLQRMKEELMSMESTLYEKEIMNYIEKWEQYIDDEIEHDKKLRKVVIE